MDARDDFLRRVNLTQYQSALDDNAVCSLEALRLAEEDWLVREGGVPKVHAKILRARLEEDGEVNDGVGPSTIGATAGSDGINRVRERPGGVSKLYASGFAPTTAATDPSKQPPRSLNHHAVPVAGTLPGREEGHSSKQYEAADQTLSAADE